MRRRPAKRGATARRWRFHASLRLCFASTKRASLRQVARIRSRGHPQILRAAPTRSRHDQIEPAEDHRRWHRLALPERAQARAEGLRAVRPGVHVELNLCSRLPFLTVAVARNERPLWVICFSVLVALALSAAAPALARDTAKMPLVGVLRINTPATNDPGATMLRKALADVGDVDGHNLRLEFRLAEGHAERYPAMAERLVRDGASVIIAYGVPPVRAAQNATTTIPIVAVAYDLVDAGFIKSLAKPGGNITGVSILSPELATKKLDILKEIVPAARRFGVLT